MRFTNATFIRNIGVGLLALLLTLQSSYAERAQPSSGGGSVSRGGSAATGGRAPRGEPTSRGARTPRTEPSRAPAQRSPGVVERPTHGTIRHVDTHVVERPVVVGRNPNVQQHARAHHDVDVDVNRSRFWHGFVFGARRPALPPGYVQIFVNNAPYYYDDGIYYQPADDAYQEVYPPVGANVPQLPDGAIEIDAGNLVYYYAGGAFYVEQDGGFAIAPAPMGVTVPELPPGAVRVSVNNSVAYQFNGIYYQPVFENGVTQYMTFMP